MSNFVTLSKRNVLASSSTDVNNPIEIKYTPTLVFEKVNFVEHYHDEYANTNSYGITVNNTTTNKSVPLKNTTRLMCFKWFTYTSNFSTWRFRMFEQFVPTPYQHAKLLAITPNTTYSKRWPDVMHGLSALVNGGGTAYCFDVSMEKDVPYPVVEATGYGANVYSSVNSVVLSTDVSTNTLKVVDVISLDAAAISSAPGTLGSRVLFTKQYSTNNIAFAIMSDYYQYNSTFRKGGMGGAWFGRFVGMTLTFVNNKLTITENFEEIDRYNMDNYWYKLRNNSSRLNINIWVVDTTNLQRPETKYILDPQDGT